MISSSGSLAGWVCDVETELQAGQEERVRDRLVAELARLARGDAYQALGLTRESDTAELRRAFLQATRAFHPSRFAGCEHATLHMAHDVFLQLKDAHAQLKDVVRRSIDRPHSRHHTPSASTRIGIAQGARPVRVPVAIPTVARATTRSVTPVAVAKRTVTPVALRARGSQTVRATARQPTPSPAVRPGRVVQNLLERARTKESECHKAFETALASSEAGDFAQARRQFLHLASSNPTTTKFRVQMHYCRGREYEEQGRTNDAAMEYRRALDLNPAFPPAVSRAAALSSGTWRLASIFRRR